MSYQNLLHVKQQLHVGEKKERFNQICGRILPIAHSLISKLAQLCNHGNYQRHMSITLLQCAFWSVACFEFKIILIPLRMIVTSVSHLAMLRFACEVTGSIKKKHAGINNILLTSTHKELNQKTLHKLSSVQKRRAQNSCYICL